MKVRALNIIAILLAGFLLPVPHAASGQSGNATSPIAPTESGERESNGPNAGWRGTVGYGTGQLPPLAGQQAVKPTPYEQPPWRPREQPWWGQVYRQNIPNIEREVVATALTQQVKELEEQGRYLEAIPLAQRVLAIHEARLGPHDPEVASACTIWLKPTASYGAIPMPSHYSSGL